MILGKIDRLCRYPACLYCTYMELHLRRCGQLHWQCLAPKWHSVVCDTPLGFLILALVQEVPVTGTLDPLAFAQRLTNALLADLCSSTASVSVSMLVCVGQKSSSGGRSRGNDSTAMVRTAGDQSKQEPNLQVGGDDVSCSCACSVQLDFKLHPCCILGCHRNELQPVCCCVVCLQ